MFLSELALGKEKCFQCNFLFSHCLDFGCGMHIYIQIKRQRDYPEQLLFRAPGDTVQVSPCQRSKQNASSFRLPCRIVRFKTVHECLPCLGKKLVRYIKCTVNPIFSHYPPAGAPHCAQIRVLPSLVAY